MSKVLNEEILKMEKLAPSIYKMTISSEYVAQNAKPGQFVNVKCSEGINALLRRPISICDVDREKNAFDIVFQIKGIGTEYLAQKPVGSKVDIIAPLGNPFQVSPQYKRVAVVGGGIGVFPLLYLLKQYKEADRSAFLGFRNREFAVLTNEFENAAQKLQVSSDDGSIGHKGLITDLLQKDLEKGSFDIIFTCGPTPMIRKVAQMAEDYNVKCQVSLEQRMGCGIGACLVCACKTRLGEDWEYSHVCKDGPVFWSEEIVFE